MKKINRWGSDRPGWSTVSKMSIPLAYADHHYWHMPKISLGIHTPGRWTLRRYFYSVQRSHTQLFRRPPACCFTYLCLDRTFFIFPVWWSLFANCFSIYFSLFRHHQKPNLRNLASEQIIWPRKFWFGFQVTIFFLYIWLLDFKHLAYLNWNPGKLVCSTAVNK